MSELDRKIRSDPAGVEEADEGADREAASDAEYEAPVADVGDAQRGEGLDHMGGYGNRPIPQEGGPNQDH